MHIIIVFIRLQVINKLNKTKFNISQIQEVKVLDFLKSIWQYQVLYKILTVRIHRKNKQNMVNYNLKI
jgi:hypothetical protein